MLFDFEQDLRNELHAGFSAYGAKLPIKANLHDFLHDYLTILKKLIFPRPRSVHYNPEFLQRLPSLSKRDEILHLERLFKQGKDVNHYQSKRLFQTNFHDHLAYEWNIYHLHLSFEKDKKTLFVKQVDQLLFVQVSNDSAIFLDTAVHTKGIFGDPKWIQILHDHFSDRIESLKDSTIHDVYPQVNPFERQTLWDKGYTLGMTKIGNAVYHSPGIGRFSSGHSILVGIQADEVIRWLGVIRSQFTAYSSKICEILSIKETEVRFKLRLGPENLEIIEGSTDTTLLIYPNIVDEKLFG